MDLPRHCYVVYLWQNAAAECWTYRRCSALQRLIGSLSASHLSPFACVITAVKLVQVLAVIQVLMLKHVAMHSVSEQAASGCGHLSISHQNAIPFRLTTPAAIFFHCIFRLRRAEQKVLAQRTVFISLLFPLRDSPFLMKSSSRP